jgi:hypothetical protein
MMEPTTPFPLPLADYPAVGGLADTLRARIALEPVNAAATAIFAIAIVHTFVAPQFAAMAHRVQERQDAAADVRGRRRAPSARAELLHFLGEVEVVFGLWAVVLLVVVTGYKGWATATGYFGETVNYTEALFVVVIMALASTRPIVGFAEHAMRRLAGAGGGTPAAWWVTILTVGPVMGSVITEPAAMTISALLLARQFYDLGPSSSLKYATLGLLFVNVSIGGTLTHFAAPPVLMVARPWGWDTAFMFTHFGWRALVAIAASTSIYFAIFRRELRQLASQRLQDDIELPDEEAPATAQLLPIPAWLVIAHLAFITWTVANAHHPALFIGGFLFFLGFARATAAYQSRIELRAPLLVGFFLGGLVIHGGLQAWWIAPVIGSLSAGPLFVTATVLTGFNDNALITYLGTLVPHLDAGLKAALVAGAVTGGGLTVIANAPNPAGQALLGRFFGESVLPLKLFAGALLPTVVAALAFRLW